MNTLAMLLAITALVYPLLLVVQARRDRKKAAYRLQMAQAVAELEELILKGKIQRGKACHDELFKLMFKGQFIEHFAIVHDNKPSSPASDSKAEKILSELNENSPALRPFRKFTDAYMKALWYSHPIALPIAHGIQRTLCLFSFPKIEVERIEKKKNKSWTTSVHTKSKMRYVATSVMTAPREEILCH